MNTAKAKPSPVPLRQQVADLGIVALTLVVATVLLVGTFTMEVRGKSVPGPTFFPLIVSIFLFIVGIMLAYLTLRVREPEHWHAPDISADMLSDFGAEGELHSYEANVRAAQLGAEAAATSSEPQPAVDPDTEHPVDWIALGWCLGGLFLFTVTLNFLGWVLSAALLFWCGTKAFGSQRPVFDIGVGLLLSSTIQLLFSAGLGLSLPSGFLGGIF